MEFDRIFITVDRTYQICDRNAILHGGLFMKVSMIYVPGESIALVINGKRLVADSTHKNFDEIITAMKEERWDDVSTLVNPSQAINDFGAGEIVVVDGQVLYDGMEVHSTLTERIQTMIKEGFNVEPMIAFMKNLMENPSESSREELYDFLQIGQLPITEDGHFLAYKKVGSTYFDKYSNSFDNSIGSVCEMSRESVNPNREQVCSRGLHFCSFAYLDSYGGYTSSGDHTMIVKINPRDVVSIPSDYNNTKGRCCRYEVIGEFEYEEGTQPAFEASVFSDDDDYEENDNESFFDDMFRDDPQLRGGPSAEYIEAYHIGYSNGRKKIMMWNGVKTAPAEVREGYNAGYKDGVGHKVKAFKSKHND